MLWGSASTRFDEKNRVKVPAKFRGTLESKYGREYFITFFPGESIRIYPVEVWRTLEVRLSRASSSIDPLVARFKKHAHLNGHCASMDSQGRVLVQTRLRKKAGLGNEITILGQQDYLELWNQDEIENDVAQNPLSPQELSTLTKMIDPFREDD